MRFRLVASFFQTSRRPLRVLAQRFKRNRRAARADPRRNRTLRFGAAALSLVGAAALWTSAAASAGDAAAVLARYKSASGGERWDRVRTLAMTGTKTTGGLEGEWRATQDLHSGRYVESARLGSFDQAEGYDGSVAWRRDPGGEIALLDGAAPLRRACTQAWLAARAYWYATRLPARYAALQSRSFEGLRYDVVATTPAGGNPIDLWFDAQTGLLARVVQPVAGSSLAFTFGDYREIEGLRLPHHVAIDATDSAGRTDPRQRSELHLQRYALNATATAADFAAPPMPTNARIDNAEGVTRIPFDLLNNHVYVDAEVDGKPARFLVDTGAVNLLTPAAAKRLGLSNAGKFSVGGAGDENAEFGFARGRSLRVGEAILADPIFYVLDLGQQPDSMGVVYDGYIGYEMFRRFGTTFDYAKRVLTFAEPARYRPPAGAKAVKFEQDHFAPILAGTLDGIALRLWVDSGSRNSLSLQSPFVRKHGLIEKYRAGETAVVGWGIGGPSRAQPVRLGALTIGGLQVDGLVGDLSTTDKGALANTDLGAILGGGVLRRFTVGIDYATKHMYLAPNVEFGRPDPFDRSGLWLQADGDVLRVGEVASRSAAARAQLRENDRIVSIGGEPVSKRNLSEWRARLRELPAGTRLAIGFRRDGRQAQAELVLAERIPARWKSD